MPRNPEIGATRGSYIYPLRLPDDLREQWATYCERNKKKAPAILRALMRYLIRDDMPPEVRRWIAEQAEGRPDDGPKERLEVRFTPTEFQSITARDTEKSQRRFHCFFSALSASSRFKKSRPKSRAPCARCLGEYGQGHYNGR